MARERDIRFKEEVVESYIEGTLIRDIVSEYEVSTSSIYRWLGDFGIERTVHRNRIYDFNENYFDDVDTTEKAYWLGVLASQGALLDFRHTIKITASKSNKDWLTSFLKAIGSTDTAHEISGTNTLFAAVRSRSMFEYLEAIGVQRSRPEDLSICNIVGLTFEQDKAFIEGWNDARDK